jgi:hypothetical protein
MKDTPGFEIGGAAQNFCKPVTIANVGDVHSAARETLRIFVEILGYRGRTPLVARISTNTRAERGYIYRSLTVEDVQKILWHAGCAAERAEGLNVPVLNIEHDGIKYGAILYGGSTGNLYECVDLRVYLGRARRSDLARLNAVNGSFRGVKAYIDDDGEAWLVQGISTAGGLTEDGVVALAEQFEQVLRDPRVTQLAGSLERDATDKRDRGRKAKTAESVH